MHTWIEGCHLALAVFHCEPQEHGQQLDMVLPVPIQQERQLGFGCWAAEESRAEEQYSNMCGLHGSLHGCLGVCARE